MANFKYTIDGKEYNVEIGEVNENIANVTVNGEAFTVEMEQKAEPEKKKPVLGQPKAESTEGEVTSAANVNANNALKAPLPGVVTEIKVAVGDEVSAGDTLVVLEAMKMANDIVAEADGTVNKVLVAKGQSVNQGDALVDFQAAAAPAPAAPEKKEEPKNE